MTHITIDPDTLERLIRGYHTPNNHYKACQCGRWTTTDGRQKTRKANHTSHVNYEIREALAGRPTP